MAVNTMPVSKYLCSLVFAAGVGITAHAWGAVNVKGEGIQPLNDAALRTQATQIGSLGEGFRVAIIYQPDCEWCEKQAKDLSALSEGCETLTALLLGTKGSKRKLRASAAKMSASLPAFEASKPLLRKVGGVPATPITLVIDDDDQVVAQRRAYMPKAQLREVLQIISDGHCPITD